MQKQTQQISRSSLRSFFRCKRRQLSPLKQRLNAKKISSHLIQLKQYQKAKHIAVYLSNDGEIDLYQLIQILWKANKNCYLPVLDKKLAMHLLFLPYKKNQKLINNCFNIAEPIYHYKNALFAKNMDIIFMPLVAFDNNNNRLGMGGGYYDRSLAFIQKRSKKPIKPLLIGVAHALQKTYFIPTEPWDIRLNSIYTEKGRNTTQVTRLNKRN